MKRITLFLAGLFLMGMTAQATSNTSVLESGNTLTLLRGYNGNAFIFVEGGIEFSVFPDGQFDFYIPQYGPNVNIGIQSPNFSFSFNSGYDYGAYVQYDDFGAIIQIENVPIYYDYYGRISRAGDVRIRYNTFGYVSVIGGLYIHYNSYHRFTHCTGFINPWNRYYVYRPWHRYYLVPTIEYRVVFNRPYRRYYTPVRYAYTRPFINNYRRPSAVYSRRGTTVTPNRSLATVRDHSNSPRRRNDLAMNSPRNTGSTATPRSYTPRSNQVVPRSNAPRGNHVAPRSSSVPKSNNNHAVTPRPKRSTQVTTGSSAPKPRTIAPKRNGSKPRSTVKKTPSRSVNSEKRGTSKSNNSSRTRRI